MKRIKLYLLIIPFSFILFSCVDSTINMLTKINPDGSCTREFTEITIPEFITGDTLENNPFPFTIDSLWDIDVVWDTDSGKVIHKWPFPDFVRDTTRKKDNLRARAIRHFPLVEDLNSYNFFELTNWKSFHPEVSFEKKFKWFYTYYQYKEWYRDLKLFDKVPISEFLDEEEVEVWFQGNDSYFNGMNGIEISERLDEIKTSYEIWLERNMFEDQYEIIINHLDLIESSEIQKSVLVEKKDTIFKKYRAMEEDFPKLLIIMDTIFNTNVFSEIIGKDEDVQNKEESLYDIIDFYEVALNYTLLIPGKIIKTNSSVAKGDTLIWKVDTYRFMAKDYKIYAESRKPNIWAFVISAIFILGVALSYFRK